MQRNRSYNDNPDWDNQDRNRDEYYHQEPDFRSRQQPGQNWDQQQFPDDRMHAYQDREQRNRQRRPDRDDNPGYRGAYQLDNSSRDREDYRQLNRENFGQEYGYGHAGNSRNGGDRGRHQSDYGSASTYGASRNAGSMGSYGGAQGFGSGRNGAHNESWASGHGRGGSERRQQVYGGYRDKNSFAAGESESYDGSQRYGSQGSDNSRGWESSGRSGSSGPYRQRTDEDDSRYEIYDTAQSQYNRGDYGNSTQGSISDDLNLRSHQNYPPGLRYGSLQRGHNRQGSGNDQDRYTGTPDMGYSNTAGSLSIGYDGHRGEAGPRNRYYDPLTGDTMNPGR